MTKENWDKMTAEEDSIRVDVNRAWTKVYGRLKREELIPVQSLHKDVGFSLRSTIQIAASVLIIAGLATIMLTLRPAEKMHRMSVNTAGEQEFGLFLPDGSTVDLNADSKIKYRLLNNGNRMVSLKGEAFFEVQPDEDKPFIIKVGKATVRVTGTSFSVRTIPDSNRIEVFVESGNVQFCRTRKQDRVLSLKEGETGVLEQNRLSRKDTPEPNQLAWKSKKLIFRETRLGDVAGVLNRTYSQKIRFTNEALEDCLFTGTFDQQPIDSVMKVIQVAFDLDLVQSGKAYVLSGDGCN